MKYKIKDIKKIKDDYYDRLVIYYNNGETRTFTTDDIETISVQEKNGIYYLHVGDFRQGLWNFYEDGRCEHWFYRMASFDDRKAIGFDIEKYDEGELK